MYIDELTDKSIFYDPALKARATEIRPLTQSDTGSLEQVIRELKASHASAEYWDYLSSSEKVLLEEKWTKILLMLLRISNLRVMRSIRYRLSEQTADENDVDEGMGN